MATFDELKKKIKACKTHAELDELRLPLVRFVPEGGEVDDFYKLQKMFRSQKVVASRLPSTIERRERKAAQHRMERTRASASVGGPIPDTDTPF
jgi:hypothetical protein